MREEAERAEAVVDRDDHRAVGRELGAVVVAGAVLDETSAVDPHQHRPAALIVIAYRRRVDVQVQAVLADRPGRREWAGRLRAARPELRRVADAPPAGRRLRGAPPQVAGRGSGVGNAEKLSHGACGRAADGAVAGGHDRGAAGARRRGPGAGRGRGGAGCCEGQRGQRRAADGGQPGAPPVGCVHDLDPFCFARAGAEKPVSSWGDALSRVVMHPVRGALEALDAVQAGRSGRPTTSIWSSAVSGTPRGVRLKTAVALPRRRSGRPWRPH